MPSPLRQLRRSPGFTLVELLVTTLVGGLVLTAAGTALITHLRSSEPLEALERQRADWSRSTFFLEAEVALSREVISGAPLTALAIPATCSGISHADLRLALRLQPNMAPVLYAVKASESPWQPANSLWRCGPDIIASGAYDSTSPHRLRLLVDGLDGAAPGGGLSVTAATDDRQLNFTLGLLGLARNTYSQRSISQGRVTPYYERPDAKGLCWSNTNIPATGTPQVVCNGDLAGISTVLSLVVEKPNSTTFNLASTIGSWSGNLRVLGTSAANTFFTGRGDDVLVGLAGDDRLSGGAGFNRYLPGTGNDTVTGGNDVDVVFYGPRSAYSLSSGCGRAACTVTSTTEGTDSLTLVDVLVFTDQPPLMFD